MEFLLSSKPRSPLVAATAAGTGQPRAPSAANKVGPARAAARLGVRHVEAKMPYLRNGETNLGQRDTQIHKYLFGDAEESEGTAIC